MTTQAYQQRNQERLAQAVESVKIYEEFGFATVASTSEADKTYFVDFDKNFHATHCTCDGNAKWGMDCLHMLALDRVCDDRRPSFYQGMHKVDFKAERRAAYVAMFDPGMVA